MRKRILTTGTTLMLALTFGTAGVTGVALAGEDDDSEDDAPDVTQQAPAPAPVPVVQAPAPQAPATPAPAVTKPTSQQHSSNQSGSSQGTSAAPSVPTSQPVAVTTTSTDSGVVPQGGIQAGGGGTAPRDGSLLILALAMGGIAFGLTSAGLALRRRAAEG
jgi:hypothetical protein